MRYIFLFIIFVLLGCQPQNFTRKNSSGKYSLLVQGKEGQKPYLFYFDSIQGNLDPLKNGVRIPEEVHYGLMVKGNFSYYLNEKTCYFKKYKIEEERFITVDSTHLNSVRYLESYRWIGDSLLFMTGQMEDYVHPAYALINTKNFEVLKEGVLSITMLENRVGVNTGFIQFRDSTFFIGYNFYYKGKEKKVILEDTLKIAVLSYPDMKLCTTIKESKAVRTLDDNRFAPTSFKDEYNNIYFISAASDRFGDCKQHPSGLFRIKSKSMAVDSTYFFNLTKVTGGNHLYACWYLSKGKAILKCDNQDQIQRWSDYDKKYIYNYYMADFQQQTISKIDLPADKGWWVETVLVDLPDIYFANRPEDGDAAIWKYNMSSKQLTPEATLKRDFSYVLRFE